jgi:hypothetical protein
MAKFLAALFAFGILISAPARCGAGPTTQPSAKDIPVLEPGRLNGWTTPKPPYPAAARLGHEQGRVFMFLTTDATGRIIKVTTAKVTTHPILDAFMARWIPDNWHGTPKTTVLTFITFHLG